MKIESNRIFISDLPETATKEEIETAFEGYGTVTSIDIKERKELGQKNTSLFFAYVTINTDAKNLQICFKDFSSGKWLGQYVMLQVARESFLDRLKRERENNISSPKPEDPKDCPPVETREQRSNGNRKNTSKKYESDSSSSESEQESNTRLINNNKQKESVSQNYVHEVQTKKSPEKETTSLNYDPDLIIKDNRAKSSLSKVLKIESVGKEPIIVIDKAKKKPALNTTEANLKRLESIKNQKKGYQNQKSLIQAALARVDTKSNNKIIFNKTLPIKQDDLSVNNKNSLFNDDSEGEFEPSFSVKDHFQGKKGQKLLELQSKYKNDRRFTLDDRFLEDDNIMETPDNPEIDEEMSLEEEKKKEYQILGQILGKTVAPKEDKLNSSKKKMLRFDPSQPDHSKYEISQEISAKKRKQKSLETELIDEKRQDEKSVPEVSKEVFFKVSDNLKETFEEKKEFSLLSMFGKTDEQKSIEEEETETTLPTNKPNSFHKEKNPFRYDSSDDEDETEDIPSQNKIHENNASATSPSTKKDTRRLNPWTDPFFFKPDDYRLQEGFDFVEKMKSEDKTEFSKLRRDLKEIVRAKVRNNLRKNRPFKKKLGGSRKKKVLRMKKAMKR